MRDDTGRPVSVPTRVTRVVSLVPSLTESIAVSAPGLLVGATSWCTHPAGLDVVRIGGTKNPDVAGVLALRPDLVVANAEENREVDLDSLRHAGLAVWVTAPETVADALVTLPRMLHACGLAKPTWLENAERAWQARYRGPRRRAFVPIWRRPWMSLGRSTFAGDLLARIGVDHVYADAADRYPRVDLVEARARGVDLVILPDEPYAFSPQRDLDAFTGWGVPVAFVSGRHLTWYGPSLVQARSVLTEQLAVAVPAPG